VGKGEKCEILNDKRLIYVKNIYPKGAIFSLPMFVSAAIEERE
jgi:hypothetical protein